MNEQEFTPEEMEIWRQIDEARRLQRAVARPSVQRPLPVDMPGGRPVASRPTVMREEGGEMPRRAMPRPLVARPPFDLRRMLALAAAALLIYGVAAPVFLPTAVGLFGYFAGMVLVVAAAVWLALRSARGGQHVR